jgi:hypothetical protein
LLDYLVDDNINITINELIKIYEILAKIASWWIREVELPTNPDFVHFNHEELEKLVVHSGPMIVLSHLIELLKISEASKLQ